MSVRHRNLQLEIVYLLMRGSWTVAELAEKIDAKDRGGICLALNRMQEIGIAQVSGKRRNAPVWRMVDVS